MANAIPKQYLTLAGEPLIFHVIRVFINNPRIAGVHIALNKDDDLWRSFNINADARLHIHHTGGGARSETVSNTLQALEANEQDWVLVHDAARPGLSAALLTQLLDQLQNDEVGGLLAMPVADTLKKSDVNNHIEHTVSRQNLWQAQTPQMFRYNQLKQALADFDGLPTDEAEAIELVNGPDAFTPDGYYAMGPVPGLKGFYVAAGGSDNGIAGGGGVGMLMAEWILEGETSIDTHEMNIRRFGPHLKDKNFRVEQCREVIRYYYHLRYPGDENEWGRPLRTSPLYERLKEHGAVFGLKNGWERANYFDTGNPWHQAGADQKNWGWERPPYFDKVGSEVKAAREKVALFDMTSFGKIHMRGSGALDLLQELGANNFDKPVGSVTLKQTLFDTFL